MEIPFYPNSEHGNNCMQACMSMILRYYFPEKEFPIAKINELTGVGNRKIWSNIRQATVVLDDLGLNVRCYSDADIDLFLEDPEKYLEEHYEDWKNIRAKIDLDLNVKFTKECIKRGLFETKKTDFKEIESFFDEGCLIMPAININVFENKKGYQGHFVLITDITKDKIYFHDPGLPPIPNRIEKKNKFIKAYYSHDTSRGLVVVSGKK